MNSDEILKKKFKTVKKIKKMCKIEKFLLISVIVLLKSSLASHDAKYECEVLDSTRCFIKGLNLTRDNFYIEPVADNLTAITSIHLHGTVPILSSSICDTMPDLAHFYAANLTDLDLSLNNFMKVDRDTIKEFLNIDNVEILHAGRILRKLKEFLGNQSITAFRAKILIEQTNLKYLCLKSNNLFDLDVETILKHAPNLEKIDLADNNFKCSRVKIILDLLEEKNIKVGEKGYEIYCLDDEEWEIKLNKLLFEKQSLDENVTNTDEQPTTLNEPQAANTFEKDKTNSNQGVGLLHKENQDLPKNQDQDEKLANVEKKLDNVLEILQTLDTKIVALQMNQNEQILNLQENINKGLEMLNKEVKGQDERIFNLKENLNNGFESLHKNFQQAYEALYGKISNDLQKSQNETQIECYKVFEAK